MRQQSVPGVALETQIRPSSFLQQIRIDYGNPEMLGRFFLKALAAVEERGITLEIGTFEDLLEANIDNRDSWLPLLTILDHRFSRVTPEDAFCVLGRDANGKVVAAHAARLFDWSATSYFEEARSLRLFYTDPSGMMRPSEQCIVTAPSARKISGQVVYSGAAWYHPRFRGRQLSAIFPKIGKALAFTRWSPDFICSMMQEAIHARGFATQFDYPVVDWAVRLLNSPLGGDWQLALVSMDGVHALKIVRDFLDSFPIGTISVRGQGRA